MLGLAAAAADGGVEVAGVRLTRGDAVTCPTIRSDDGTVRAVSFLPADIAVGERVTVRGRVAVTTRCAGPVVVVFVDE